MNQNLIFPSAMILAGVLLGIASWSYSFESSMLLRALSVLMTLLSLLLFFNELRTLKLTPNQPKEALAKEKKPFAWDTCLIFLIIAATIFLIPVFGFIVTFAVVVYLVQVVIAKRHKNLYIYVAIGVTLVIYLIFFAFLGISPPHSIISVEQYLQFY